MTSKSPKEAILAELAEESDQKAKRLLLLLLSAIENIGEKLDAVLENEDRLRTLVLNGHAPVHHDDHEWVGRRRKTDERDLRVLAWAEAQMKQDDAIRRRSTWVDAQMQEAEAEKDSRRALRDKWLERVMWSLTVVAALGISHGLNFKALLP